jgi:hypothetical protein
MAFSSQPKLESQFFVGFIILGGIRQGTPIGDDMDILNFFVFFDSALKSA